MSALSFISGYGSTSEESDLEESQPKKLRFQLPDLSSIPVVCSEAHLDDPSLHGGRVRSFPHIRGNWASFVYIRFSNKEALHNLIERLLAVSVLESQKSSCHICDDLHISLSKTVVLQYHLITAFRKSLQEAFNNIECFDLEFGCINIYCNEDNTRTFVSLEVDYTTKNTLLELTKKVDGVLEEFKLPLFYENPSFHMSILWLNGDKKTELTRYLEDFNSILNEELGNSITPVLVSDLNCKIGNKYFQFSLQ